MRLSQIATWACIPLLTCRGVAAAEPPGGPTPPSFSLDWNTLGPFEIGTRESSWGADPLEAYGGFHTLDHNITNKYLSSLGWHGEASWSTSKATVKPGVTPPEYMLNIHLPPDNVTFLQQVYGWDGLQYQAWARGSLTIPGPASESLTVAISSDRIWELRVDGKLYFGGDFFAFRRAPLILNLKGGVHTVELRVVRDVRALGGVGPPDITISLVAQALTSELHVDSKSGLVADVVQNRLVSPYTSITLLNAMGTPVEVMDIKPEMESSGFSLKLLKTVRLEGYQSRAVGFTIDMAPNANLTAFPTQVSFTFGYSVMGTTRRTMPATIKFTPRQLADVQQNTFIHPGGVVSYSTMRPPSPEKCKGDKNTKYPVLLGLHGAGQAASDEIIRTMLDGVADICAWTVFPSGVTPWSGDDWHTWGFADLQNAVYAVKDYITHTSWTGPSVAEEDWVVAGHSNGGQGTWYTLSHYPDNIIAAAPVSGYTSIENYVPYSMWHNTDSLLAGIFERARQDFKHELLLNNFVGIPVHQQHGNADDNVAVYHSRLMHRLMEENGWSSEYNEVDGMNHWWTGVMYTQYLKDFYYKYVQRPNSNNMLPTDFAITIPAAGYVGSRGGIIVDQAHTPDRAGSINVHRDVTTGWKITTRNIRRFHILQSAIRAPLPSQIQIDGSGPFTVKPGVTVWYTQGSDGKWEEKDGSWRTTSERHGRQAGINAILRTPDSFAVSSNARDADDLALQTCRNLFQYLSADCDLYPASSTRQIGADQKGNIITLWLGSSMGVSKLPDFPISLTANGLAVKTEHETVTYPLEAGLGAIFLRPLENERLELVVWGHDIAGLQQAARLVPVLTGVGQSDFVVVNHGTALRGQDSLYAAGFFDSTWKVSAASYVS